MVPSNPDAARGGACPLCGGPLRQVDHVTLGLLDAYVCASGDYGRYGPRSVDAARARHRDLMEQVATERGGTVFALSRDTHCPMDGRRDLCSRHGFMNLEYHADLVLRDEFGEKIRHHVDAPGTAPPDGTGPARAAGPSGAGGTGPAASSGSPADPPGAEAPDDLRQGSGPAAHEPGAVEAAEPRAMDPAPPGPGEGTKTRLPKKVPDKADLKGRIRRI